MKQLRKSQQASRENTSLFKSETFFFKPNFFFGGLTGYGSSDTTPSDPDKLGSRSKSLNVLYFQISSKCTGIFYIINNKGLCTFPSSPSFTFQMTTCESEPPVARRSGSPGCALHCKERHKIENM
jgi:hypothetical protein